MEGLQGFHKRVHVVVQGMLRPLIQAPLHICTILTSLKLPAAFLYP